MDKPEAETIINQPPLHNIMTIQQVIKKIGTMASDRNKESCVEDHRKFKNAQAIYEIIKDIDVIEDAIYTIYTNGYFIVGGEQFNQAVTVLADRY